MSNYGTAQVCPEYERRTERLRRRLLTERRRAAATGYEEEEAIENGAGRADQGSKMVGG